MAFLPFIHVKLKAKRPLPYSEHPQTLGEHLKRKRLLSNQLQREVAARLGATHAAYLHWETGQTEPFVRYYPKIIEFLEYVPWTEATSLAEELLQFRRLNGWSIRQASAALNVDQGTWGRWEEGMEPKHGSHKQLLAELFRE